MSDNQTLPPPFRNPKTMKLFPFLCVTLAQKQDTGAVASRLGVKYRPVREAKINILSDRLVTGRRLTAMIWPSKEKKEEQKTTKTNITHTISSPSSAFQVVTTSPRPCPLWTVSKKGYLCSRQLWIIDLIPVPGERRLSHRAWQEGATKPKIRPDPDRRMTDSLVVIFPVAYLCFWQGPTRSEWRQAAFL